MKEKRIERVKKWIEKLLNRTAAIIPSPKQAFPENKFVIKPAFQSGGIWYYTMDDIFNIPYQRGLEAVHAYEELKMKCDLEYLREHSSLISELLSKSIGLDELSRIKAANDQLKQRLEWVVIPDQAYKLASIVFFDANEDPSTYEIGYARQKIELWKQNADVESFFLQQPVSRLMPFLHGFDGSFLTYSALIEKVNRDHLRNLSGKFSPNLAKLHIAHE
jgi:hypothetical protein